MLQVNPVSVFALSLLAASTLQAQAVEIADWQGNASGAVSLTFDDSLDGHWSHADPIMTAAGIRGTFFVITGSVDWNGARAAALNEHEIGSHSTDTTSFDILSVAETATRMQSSHDAVEAQIGTALPGYQCHSIAWPSGKRKLEVVNDSNYKDLYLSARNAGNTLLATNSYNVANTTNWWKYGQGTYGLDHFFVVGDALMSGSVSLSTFEAQLDLAKTQNAWTVFTYHGIETGGYANISAAEFTAQVGALAARNKTLYIAPYGEVARYVRQRDDAVASLVSDDGTTLTLSLTDSLDDTVFNIPLTLVLNAPDGWTDVTALQEGSSINAWVEAGKILVNAVPDAGPITIQQAAGPEIKVPVLDIVPMTASTVQLSWNSESGLQYEVMLSSDTGSWNPLTPARIISGDGTRKTEEVPYTSPRLFYILEVSTEEP